MEAESENEQPNLGFEVLGFAVGLTAIIAACIDAVSALNVIEEGKKAGIDAPPGLWSAVGWSCFRLAFGFAIFPLTVKLSEMFTNIRTTAQR